MVARCFGAREHLRKHALIRGYSHPGGPACGPQELFDRSPEVRDELFSTKPAELLASKLGEILAEVVRMLAIETPTELLEQLTEMALRHIAYGLRNEHVEPFKDALLHSLKHTIKLRGFKWNQRTKRAWSWSLTEITDLLMDAVNTGRPKVQNLQRCDGHSVPL